MQPLSLQAVLDSSHALVSDIGWERQRFPAMSAVPAVPAVPELARPLPWGRLALPEGVKMCGIHAGHSMACSGSHPSPFRSSRSDGLYFASKLRLPHGCPFEIQVCREGKEGSSLAGRPESAARLLHN